LIYSFKKLFNTVFTKLIKYSSLKDKLKVKLRESFMHQIIMIKICHTQISICIHENVIYFWQNIKTHANPRQLNKFLFYYLYFDIILTEFSINFCKKR
jgi:hypothetical protein